MFRKKRSSTKNRNSLGFIFPVGPALSSADLTPFLSENNNNGSKSDLRQSNSSSGDRDEQKPGRSRISRRLIRRR
jgi:hypothetical protein